MASSITTRQALEVVLSRVPMNRYSQRDLTIQLSATIRKGEEGVIGPEGTLASIHLVLDILADVDESYSKRLIIERLRDARRDLRKIVGQA